MGARGTATIAAAVAIVALGTGSGCDGDDETTTASTTTASEPETAEHVDKLPKGWKVARNPELGFEMGRPPGWPDGRDCLRKGADPGTATVMCSPDELVTLSVSADRTDEAFQIEEGEFAERTMQGLGDSYEGGLDPRAPKPVKGHYDGAAVTARGTAAATGVNQDVTVVVLRRDAVANFTAVIAANAHKPTTPAVKLAERALRTLRSQPVR